MQISNRAKNTIDSPLRKFIPFAQKAEKQGKEILYLNIGQPDLETPMEILQGIKNFDDKVISYANSAGIQKTREAWVKFYKDQNLEILAEDVIITTGGSEAMMFALLAMADAGDELLVFEPLYPNYKALAQMLGIKLIPISLDIKNGFKIPSIQELETKITDKTKGIIFINPNNPTGVAYDDEQVEIIAELIEKHDLFVLSDETYREIVFDNRPRVKSLLEFLDISQNVIVVDSVSKRFSACGIRVGCLISRNPQVVHSSLKFGMARLSVASVEQVAVIPILEDSKEYIKKIRETYKNRRDLVYDILKIIPEVSAFQPQGACYIMVKLPVKNSEDFIKWMLEDFSYKNKTILVTPAEDFYITENKGLNEIRIAYVLEEEKLKDAMMVLKKGLEEYGKTNQDN